MHQTKKIQLLPQILGIIVVIATVLVSIGGRDIPRGTNLSKKVSRFNLRTYKYGLFINQPPTRVFYNFSPYDAYYLNKENDTIRFLFWEDDIVSKEFSNTQGSIKSRFLALQSAYNLIDPVATFETPEGDLKLVSETSGNKVTITLAENPYKGWELSSALTLSFNDNDFIINKGGDLLTEIDTDEIEQFQSFYGIPLNPLFTEIEETVEGTESTKTTTIFKKPTKEQLNSQEEMIIVNPLNEGVIKIDKSENPNASININLKLNTIEFIYPADTLPSVTIRLFSSLEEALK